MLITLGRGYGNIHTKRVDHDNTSDGNNENNGLLFDTTKLTTCP
jgi:hypothetical protein